MEIKPLDVDELLPQEYNENWFDEDFDKVEEIAADELIDMGDFTRTEQSSVIRNAVRDLRGPLDIPKTIISPFLNSSIEPENIPSNGILNQCS